MMMVRMMAGKENEKESKTWLGVLAFFVVLALLGPTLIFRGFFDPDHGKTEVVEADTLYYTIGVIREIDAAERRMFIEHEEIPGVMPAMTMPFTVRDASILKPFREGERVSFNFRMRDRGAWIEEISTAVPSAGAGP